MVEASREYDRVLSGGDVWPSGLGGGPARLVSATVGTSSATQTRTRTHTVTAFTKSTARGTCGAQPAGADQAGAVMTQAAAETRSVRGSVCLACTTRAPQHRTSRVRAPQHASECSARTLFRCSVSHVQLRDDGDGVVLGRLHSACREALRERVRGSLDTSRLGPGELVLWDSAPAMYVWCDVFFKVRQQNDGQAKWLRVNVVGHVESSPKSPGRLHVLGYSSS